ncbi:MAG: polysaccharide deacetylase family protein [Acetatifactor sp.]|nr:polysaccharide deacetylase family protein [Acetatifactor sp.]
MFLLLSFTGCSASQADGERLSENKQTEDPESGEQSQETDALAQESTQDNDDLENNNIQEEKNESSESEDAKDTNNGDIQTGENQDGDLESAAIEKEIFIDKLTEEGKGWGLGFGEPGTQPVGNASVQELAQYDAYFMGNDSDQVIYLTFDCGYENGNTELILDALKKHSAPATFFVVGHFLETAPELVKRMAQEGHAVGNHTWHHYDIDTLDQETFQTELEDVAKLFQELTGKELSPYYRPPEGKCGIYNLKMAEELGYSTIFWSLAYVDWDTNNQPSHEAALDKLTSRIHPGAVVLLHNTSQTNGEILDELLTKWEEMGYTFSPLSELTESGM